MWLPKTVFVYERPVSSTDLWPSLSKECDQSLG